MIASLLRLFISCLLLCAVGACQTPGSAYPDVSKDELAREREIQQNLAATRELEKQEGKERKRLEQQQRLMKVGQRIRKGGMELCKAIKQKTIKQCVYQFELTKEGRELNAYADGKKIYITPAMMRFIQSEDELAVVLGHEYAHNLMEHSKAKQRNAIIGNVLGMAVDMLAAYQGVGTSGAFSNIGSTAGALSYSQSYEKEADYVGLYVTALAGYNIKAAPGFWRRMSTRHSDAIVEATTHPTTPERFVMLRKTISEIKTKRNKKQRLLPKLKNQKQL